jgi:hypothetical protein
MHRSREILLSRSTRSAPAPGRVRRRLLTIGGTVTVMAAALVLTAVPAFACPSLTITASPTTVAAGSDTVLTISGTSNGNYTGAYIDVTSTGGPGALTSFTTLGSGGCTGGPTSCTVSGSAYKMALPALTNGEPFTYTIDLTVNSGTAPTTVTPKAEFFESNGTNIGPQAGPVITVVAPSADLAISQGPGEQYQQGSQFYDGLIAQNNGPDTVPATVTITVTQSSAILSPASADDEESYFTCTTVGEGFTCTAPLFGNQDAGFLDSFWNISLLGTGDATITATISSTATDPDPGNNSTSLCLTFLLGLNTGGC